MKALQNFLVLSRLLRVVGAGTLLAQALIAQEAPGSAAASAAVSFPVLTQTEYMIRANPAGLAAGPDGGLWYTANGVYQSGHGTYVGWIGRLDPMTGETVEKNVPGDTRLSGIASAAGQMWFGEAFDTGNFRPESGALGSFNPTPAGPLFSPSIALGASAALDLTEGSDSQLWFTAYGVTYDKLTFQRGPSGVDRVRPDGSVVQVSARPGGRITTGPDGSLWFTIPALDRIGQLSLTGDLHEFALPPGSQPSGIARSADGALWFTEAGASRIGRISTAGAITEYPIPSGGVGIAIAGAPDGAVWFRKSDTLVRVLAAATLSDPPAFEEFPALRLGGGETLLVDSDGSVWYGAGGIPNLDQRYGALVHVVPQACSGGDLCLGGRFRVHLDWRTDQASGSGVPVPRTAGFGYFWIFSDNNVEIAVKLVDGRAVNKHFWMFAASLTDVEFTLTVTDTVTGAVQTYFNPSGRLASFADTTTFPGEGAVP